MNYLVKNILIWRYTIPISYLFVFLALSTEITANLFNTRIISELLPAVFLALFLLQFILRYEGRFIDSTHSVILFVLLGYIVLYFIFINFEEPLRIVYLAKYIALTVAFFMVFKTKDQDDRWIVNVLRFFVLLLTFYSVFSILSILFGVGISSSDHTDYGLLNFAVHIGRGSGGQSGTISYAATLVMALPLVVLFRDNKIIFFSILTLIILGIVSSGGRAAFISSILYVLVSNSSIFPRLKSKKNLIFLILPIVFLGSLSDRLFNERIFGADLQRLETYLSFFDIDRGWDIVLGFGIGHTSPGIFHLAGYSITGFESYILNTLGELGLVGGTVFGFLILLRIVNLSKRHKFFFNFFVTQIPIFFLQIAHENFTVLSLFCFLMILLTSLSKESLDKYV